MTVFNFLANNFLPIIRALVFHKVHCHHQITQNGQHYADGFVDYTLDDLPSIYISMSNLYELCTGNKLEKDRM
ncbi:hypothetical protein H4J51_06580 [Colwellia sp. MB02u-18]|uniref:hypothetical protein n=1 Tax=unclassified Colwellia TaxID=196834 RepID=UPI0015F6007D|nr:MULTISPECIES: hypothetical protein [unclassified Colwellia]MBA6222627.1 hypothetical protein [Colwellia sp. MB3u-45]MBA6265970.1 hypothetical protein [Colwellia sp. MB3u-43]MBA6319625.1 hypothetical protein [Colwellia sp. MB02u-19]MBA6324243.1 hypothetical protein [Colwellia sp. MB02u-18]MBA6332792.1 hypothetical protein [Colwellia sp. MB02u-12]